MKNWLSMLIQKKPIKTVFSALTDSKQGQEHSYILRDSVQSQTKAFS